MLDRFENTTWDLIVIGSGPSGGRIAHSFAKKGARTLLLEAGRFFQAKDFPKNEISYSAQMFWSGGVELSTDARLGFLRAKCVGGTSVVNQALLDRFDDLVWSEWQTKSGLRFSDQEMEPYYDQVEASLSLHKIENKYFGKNTRYFTDGFDQKKLGWTNLRRAQKDCALERGSDCIACLGGCPRNSKQSTLVASIEPGLTEGLELLSDCEAHSVSQTRDGVEIAAFVKAGGNSGGKKTQVRLKSKAVVVAAGSFGSSKILLQSPAIAHKLRAIGKGVSCHPQYMTYSFFSEPVDAFKGAFQAVKSDDAGLRRKGMKFENVFAPPIATAMLFDGFGKSHHKIMAKYRYMASMEVAIRDEATGELTVDKSGKLLVKKTMTDQDRSRATEGLRIVKEIYEGLGAQSLIQCEQGFGLHLMGGCALGADANTSVVNENFQVHDHSRIFIADSSTFPSATGINPSLTVMALSEKALPFIEKALA